MKAVPNIISSFRIIFSVTLVFVKPLGIVFYAIYIICGLSDMVDGLIARRMGTTSTLGERLDSIADIIMIGALIIVIYPILDPAAEILIWIISIGIIRLSSMFVAFIRYKTFSMLHTYGNKITGIGLFIFPILIPFIDTTVLMYIICVVASMSAIEELIIQLTSNQLQPNKKSIFIK